MATATRIVPEVTPPPPAIRLELSEEEAKLLYSIGNWTSSSGKRGELLYNIWSALSKVGVRSGDCPWKEGDIRAMKGDDC